MQITFIQSPYNLGREDVGVASGPLRIFDSGIDEELRRSGYDTEWVRVERGGEFEDELSAITDIDARIAGAVRKTVNAGRLPFVLGGNCNTSVGALAAFDLPKTGVIWFDAHGDFNTPDTSPSGFLDGMALGVITGRCFPDMWKAAHGTQPLPDANILLAGIRDLDEPEEATIAESDVILARAADMTDPTLEAGFTPALDALRSRVARAYVHIDVDALDPSELPGVDYNCPGGLTGAHMESIIEWIGERFEIVGANVASFNPDNDEKGKSVAICARLIKKLIDTANKKAG